MRILLQRKFSHEETRLMCPSVYQRAGGLCSHLQPAFQLLVFDSSDAVIIQIMSVDRGRCLTTCDYDHCELKGFGWAATKESGVARL